MTLASPTDGNARVTPVVADGVQGHDHISSSGIGVRQHPQHPISKLQGPFEESIIEAEEKDGDKWVVELSAQDRRRDLLEKQEYERLCGRKWRQRPGERYHPFWKLISNMSFGTYLLATRLAKSEADVLRILQSYVDEVDEFIERSTEDLLIIQLDIRTRIQYLDMPLRNLDIFDEMLNDRSFRLAMVNYNEQTEHALSRFTVAARDSASDIQKGREAIDALWHFIGRLEQENSPIPSSLHAICDAMLANIEGWSSAFGKLYKRAMALDTALVQLGMAAIAMQRRVGAASRRSVVPLASDKQLRRRPMTKTLFRDSSTAPAAESDKPLPHDPDPRDVVRGRPGIERTRMQVAKAESAPNLRSTSNSRCFDETKSAGRTNQANSGEDIEADNPMYRSHRTLRKALLRSAHTKGSTTKRPESTRARSTTAPIKLVKDRSLSLDRLKALCTVRKAQQETTSDPVVSSSQLTAAAAPTGRDNLRDQLLYHVHSDKVTEAWENIISRKKRMSHPPPLQKTIDWPLSIFRAKLSNNRNKNGQPESETELTNALSGKMTWPEDGAELLNFYYSLKPKPAYDVDPRLHLPSAGSALTEDIARVSMDNHEDENDDGESVSFITALPLLPLPLRAKRDTEPGHSAESSPCSSSQSS